MSKSSESTDVAHDADRNGHDPDASPVTRFASHLKTLPADQAARAVSAAKLEAAKQVREEDLPAGDRGKVNGSAFLAKRADLTVLLRDGVPEPTYLPSDALGECLFYEGQTFLFSGHKKAGKSWAMIVQAFDCMKAKRPVVYVDNENGHELFAERLLMLGCTHQQAADYLYYVPFPDRLGKPSDLRAEFAAIAAALPKAFIVLDSLRTFMARLGLNPNVDVEVEQFLGPIMGAVKTAAERPTVGVIDHANRKGNASDDFVAAGSFAKPAAVDGAYFFTKLEPFSRDKVGTVQITVKDDRRGRLDFERFYRVGGQGDGAFEFEKIDPSQVGTSGRIFDDVCQLLADTDGPLTKTTIRKQVRGKGTDIDKALARLVADPGSPVVNTDEDGKRAPRYVWDANADQGGGIDV